MVLKVQVLVYQIFMVQIFSLDQVCGFAFIVAYFLSVHKFVVLGRLGVTDFLS